MKKLFPFLKWFPLTKDNLRADFIAGVTVALLLVPQSMAYAELAGLPARFGLYAAIFPVALMALFGNLHQISGGPTAMTSIITASVLFQLTVEFPAELREARYIELAILLSIAVGVCRLTMGIFKLSSLVNLISHPVVAGFTNAAAIVIALSQLPKLLGVSDIKIPQEFMGLLKSLNQFFNRLDEIHPLSAILGIASLLCLVYLKKLSKRVPWPLLIVAVSCFVSWFMGIEKESLLVGTIPASLPIPALPSIPAGQNLFQLFIELIPGAMLITLIGFVETVSISKAISLKTRQPLNLDQELIGQGVASIAGGLTQSYPVGSSFTRSALNLSSGAKTGMSNIFAVATVIAVLLFLTPALYYLPKSTLAALIISSTFGLINFEPVKISWKVMRREGFVAAFTFTLTLLLAPSIMDGFLWGAGLAIISYLYRTMNPAIQIHSWGADCPKNLRGRSKHIAAIHFRCAIFFASVEAFEAAVLKALSASPDIKYVLIQSQSINRIDASGEWGLRNIHKTLQENNIRLIFTALPQEAYSMMKSSGLDQYIGPENFFEDVASAIKELHDEVDDFTPNYVI